MGSNFKSSRSYQEKYFWCHNFKWPFTLSKTYFNISNNKKSCPEKNREEKQ